MSVLEFWRERWWQEVPKWHHWCLGQYATIPRLERSIQVFRMETGFSRGKKNVKQKCELSLKEAHPWVWAYVCWLWDYTESSSPVFIKKQRVQRFSTKETETQYGCCVSWVTALHPSPATYGGPPRAVFLSSLVFCQLCKMQAFRLVRNLKVWSKHWESIKISRGVKEFCCVIA